MRSPPRPAGASVAAFRSGSLALCALLVSPALAQDPPPPERADEDSRPQFRYETSFTKSISEDERLTFVQGIFLRRGDLELHCDSALLWTSVHEESRFLGRERDSAGALHETGSFPRSGETAPAGDAPTLRQLLAERFPGLREVYLEGHVLWRDGKHSTVFADRLYYDLVENRGVVEKATLFAEQPARRSRELWTLQVQAERMRTLDPSQLEVLDAVFSTCTFGDPHFDLHSDRMVLRNPSGSPFSVDDVEAVRVEAEGSTLEVGSLPVLPLPPFSFTASRDGSIPLRRLRIGRSSRLGVFERSLWGTEFHELGDSAHRLLGIDAPFEGDFELALDEFSRRGPAVGPKLEYESEGLYRGWIDTYWLHDREDEDHTRLDRPEVGGEGDPFRHDIAHPDRGRVHTQNRFHLGETTRLDAEAYYLSDEGFLREYFEREFKEDKEPESDAHLVHQDGTLRARILYRNRLNDFDTQLDSLPRLSLEQLAFPAFSLPFADQPAYFLIDHATELGSLRRHPADDVATDSAHVLRADSVVEISMPFDVGPFGVRPYAAGSATGWDESADDDRSLGRVQSSTGLRFQLPLHRDYRVQSHALSIDGLRHVMIADVAYDNLWLSTRDPDEFEALDAVEARTKVERYLLGLRQRLSTWRGDSVVTFLDFDAEIPLYPDEDRDHPVRVDRDGQPVGRTAGPLHTDLQYRPGFSADFLRDLVLRVESDYELVDQTFEAWEGSMRFQATDDAVALLSYRARRGLSRILTAGADVRLTDKWALGAFQQLDLRGHEKLEHRLRLRRYGHDFYFDLEFERDRTDRNTSLALRITPIFSRARDRDRDLRDLGASPDLDLDELR